MKRIFLLLFSALILASCSGPRGNSAGIINGTRISYPEYIRALQGNSIDFRSVTNRPPDDAEKRQIFNETWRNLSMRVILADYYKKYDISVSEAEVLDSLSTNIPHFVRSSPVFFTDGKFDPEIYQQSLRYDSPVNLSTLRNRYYNDHIPIQKLKPHIIDDELLGKKTRQSIAAILSSVVDFDLLVFDPGQMNAVVSEQELRNHYQQHLEQYAMEPLYNLRYLSLPITLQEIDLNYTYSVADSIYEEISLGKSFESILEERREYLPGLRVVDSDFVRVETVDKDVLDIVEALPEGAQSKLIRQDNGYFIYQKQQRTKSMIRYRTLQIPPVISPSTINAQHDKAMSAFRLAQSLGIADTAVELGIRRYETGIVSPGEKWHQDALVISTIESRLIQSKKGELLEPIYSSATGSWIIALIIENQVNRAQPFPEVKDAIQAEIRASRQKQLSAQKAREWLVLNPDLIVKDSGEDYELIRYQQSGIDAKYKTHDLNKAFLNAMLRHRQNQKPQAEQLEDITIILIPRKVEPQKDVQVDNQQVRSIFVQTLSPNWFELWMENKLDKANIQIFVSP
jgi:hypothetical protein